ncbi:MAG: hypothetical protein DRJ03_27350 [Chloroflexi bacterium]|nr:MAG: hypothetical protein DRJ03_27350 [Chloroflexota bacterium]
MPVIAKPKLTGTYGRLMKKLGFDEPYAPFAGPMPMLTYRQFARTIMPLFGGEIAGAGRVPPEVMALVKKIPKSVIRRMKRVRVILPKVQPRWQGYTYPSWFVKKLSRARQRKLLGRARFVRRAPVTKLYLEGSPEIAFHEAGHELESMLGLGRDVEEHLWRLYSNTPDQVALFETMYGAPLVNPHEVLASTFETKIFKPEAYKHAPEWAKRLVNKAIRKAGGIP